MAVAMTKTTASMRKTFLIFISLHFVVRRREYGSHSYVSLFLSLLLSIFLFVFLLFFCSLLIFISLSIILFHGNHICAQIPGGLCRIQV